MSHIPLPPREQVAPEDQEILSSLPPLNIYQLLANAPGVIGPWTTMVQTVYSYSFSDRVREVAILRLVSREGAEYATHQHCLLGQNVGLSQQELTALTGETPVTSLNEIENLICEAVDRLTATGTWTEDMREALTNRLGVQQTTELLITLALYTAVARLTRASNIPIEPNNPLANATNPHQ